MKTNLPMAIEPSKEHVLDNLLNCFTFIDVEKQLVIAPPIFLHLGYTVESAQAVLSNPMVLQFTNCKGFVPREDYFISIQQIGELIVNAPKDKYISHILEFIKNTLTPLFNPVAVLQIETLPAIKKPEMMSSLEIAQLTGKEHKDVMRDIRAMLAALSVDIRAQNCAVMESSYKAGTGKSYPMYLLNEELTLTLTSGYSIPQRNAIIKEWQAHRRGEVAATAPTVSQPAELSRKDLLLLALQSEEEKERLQFERDTAVRCKSWISDSREASAMGRLARANDKIKLKDEQISKLEAKLAAANQAPNYQYATILAIQSRLKFIKVSGLKLTYYCRNNGLAIKDIPDDRYGVVHSYPAQAWRDVYQIDINKVLNKVA